MTYKQINIILITVWLISSNTYAQKGYRTIDQVKGLMVGDKIENFSAMDEKGNKFILEEALKKGPVIVIFYRGHWCPVCNRQLSDMQDSLSLIHEKGATVIAISPEKVEYKQETIEKAGVQFTLLYDEDYGIAKLFDVLYKPNTSKRMVYNSFLGADLKESHSGDSQQLPVASTFIINKNKEIIWRQFDTDNKNRSSVKEIINVL